ncbi:MAG: hypothetical protein LWX56_14050 [Ignavibacteria bacterium]|nr:hypothetical protein [Ignavibacteria bacterium]
MKRIMALLVLLGIFQIAEGQTGTVIIKKKNNAGTIIVPVDSIREMYFPQNHPCPGIPTVTYADKIYHTVQIGSQCWLRENLDVGTMITEWNDQTNNGIIEKYCYNDNLTNCTIYGGLYQWNEAMQYVATPGARGICPAGWHIPTLAEFETLSSSVGGNGNALKAIGEGNAGYGGAGTNTSGFSALLAGCRYFSGGFHYLGGLTYFWSSPDEDYVGNAYYMHLYNNCSNISLYAHYREHGFSVRCLKD